MPQLPEPDAVIPHHWQFSQVSSIMICEDCLVFSRTLVNLADSHLINDFEADTHYHRSFNRNLFHSSPGFRVSHKLNGSTFNVLSQ